MFTEIFNLNLSIVSVIVVALAAANIPEIIWGNTAELSVLDRIRRHNGRGSSSLFQLF